MKRLFSKSITIFLAMTLLGIDDGDTDRDLPPLRKPAGFADEAIGVMTKGQLHNLTMNYGQITDTRFEDVGNAPTETHFNLRWPATNFTGVMDDFSLVFARQENPQNNNRGNVIDGYTDNNNEDWIAKDGSWGKTHYNAAFDPNPHETLLYEGAVPYLAHSDLPLTWPVDENGVPFWPGYFRKDPQTGEPVPGEFASDRDIYAVFTDAHNQQGPPIGIEVEMMAYDYGRIYAQDIQFYEFYIWNKGTETLDGCWVGYYLDPDCSDHGEEMLLLPDPTFSDPDITDIIAQRDFDGDIGGATRPNARGVLEDYTFGMAILETPKNVGVTSFHYYDDPGPTDDTFLWPIISSDPTSPAIGAFADQYFHGTNPNIDDVSFITEKRDLAFIVASGPFDLAPGEFVKSTIAVSVGEEDADLLANMAQAQQMFDDYFQGPTAPPAPNLTAVPGDDKVTLYWDNLSEITPDQTTGEIDFEGYKIFRSEDAGSNWGAKVTDAQGRLAGFVPVAQFDLDNNVQGADPLNSFSYLGNNSGIRHSWVDSTVSNGVKYAYTIVAYDHGDPSNQIPSFETARGSGDADRNFVSVVPRTEPSGKIPPQVRKIARTGGNGKGDVIIEIVDEKLLTSGTYAIEFSDTPARSFDIVSASDSEPVLVNLAVNESDLPVADGFRVTVLSDPKIGGIKDISDGAGRSVWGQTNVDSTGSWFVSATERTDAGLESRASDYEIRFLSGTSVSYTWGPSPVAGFDIPFEVWKVTASGEQQVNCEVNDLNSNQQWNEGEAIFILDVPYPASRPSAGEALDATFPSMFPFQILIINAPGDAQGNPPQSGDIIKVTTFRGFGQDDRFTFSFEPAAADPDAVDLAGIRVVPNPYIVTAAWEEVENVRKIRFMFLPSVCDIDVYTLSGTLVTSIHHDNGTGDAEWNLLSDSNQDLAFGIYVYRVTTPDRKEHIGKFALIK